MIDDLIKRMRGIATPGMEDVDEQTIIEAATALAAAQVEIERLEAENAGLRDFWMAWAHKRLAIQHKHYLRDAKLAIGGDMRALQNRVLLMEAEPMPIVASAALSTKGAADAQDGMGEG